jgi:hypothetical protein
MKVRNTITINQIGFLFDWNFFSYLDFQISKQMVTKRRNQSQTSQDKKINRIGKMTMVREK